jgi:hypothetical protein
MADTIGPVQGTFDGNVVDGSPQNVVQSASALNLEASKVLAKHATLNVVAETDTADLAEEYINLTGKGVTFPAGTLRRITVKTTTRDDTKAAYVERDYLVIGATDPTIAPQNVATANLIASLGGLGDTTTPLSPEAVLAVNTGTSPDEVRVTFNGGDLGAGATYRVRVEVDVHPLIALPAGNPAD